MSANLLAATVYVFDSVVCLQGNYNPTTAGLGDSERAMGYEEPWEDNREN